MRFTAIDFETANSFRGSPCSVGLTKVRDGQVVDQAYLLMKPPAGIDHFGPYNVAIHGITADMVADQPGWAERINDIRAFIQDDILVAHNAGFDISVMRYACEYAGLSTPELRFFCTLVASRRHLQLPSYSLPYVMDAFEQDFENHHDALADSRAAATVVQCLAQATGTSTIEELAKSLGVQVGSIGPEGYRGSVAKRAASAPKLSVDFTSMPSDADPSGYFFERRVVFTGELASMPRKDAQAAVHSMGGIPENTVTKRTNVVVVGGFNAGTLRPGARLSGKAERAMKLQAEGQAIEILTEAEFLTLLDARLAVSDAAAAKVVESIPPAPDIA